MHMHARGVRARTHACTHGSGAQKWIFWAFGMLMFMPIVYFLSTVATARRGISGVAFTTTGRWIAGARHCAARGWNGRFLAVVCDSYFCWTCCDEFSMKLTSLPSLTIFNFDEPQRGHHQH